MTNSVGLDRLLANARGASRRHEEALKELDRAEREKRISWETYDREFAAARSQSTSAGVKSE